MPIPVLMPALSPTMTEGKLAKWHVKVGDAVKSGEVIAEIETDKATMEVEAVDEGTRRARSWSPEGTEGVKVNTPIGILAAEGESVADAAKSAAGRRGRRRSRSAKADVASAEAKPRGDAGRRSRAAAGRRRRRPPSPNGPARRCA